MKGKTPLFNLHQGEGPVIFQLTDTQGVYGVEHPVKKINGPQADLILDQFRKAIKSQDLSVFSSSLGKTIRVQYDAVSRCQIHLGLCSFSLPVCFKTNGWDMGMNAL